jgi:predicted  nucleic acid-binding Zn-ribbon protein
MNLLGKIFVVLIFVMSIGFMFSALAVYSTHKNWRDVSTNLQKQLTESKAQFTQLQTQYNRLESSLTSEREAAEQQVRKLETERVSLVDRNVGIQNELDQLKQDSREATAAVSATQQNNEKLATEVAGLRQDIRTNQQRRDEAFAATLKATEELHQTAGELSAAQERNGQLTRQVATLTMAMRENGLDPATEPGAIVPRVDGVVSQVRRTAGAQLVEVTIGADDGLKPGHTLEVYRGGKYLGRVEIVETSPDKSVGRVDRRFQEGQIQEGDRVATRLKLG